MLYCYIYFELYLYIIYREILSLNTWLNERLARAVMYNVFGVSILPRFLQFLDRTLELIRQCGISEGGGGSSHFIPFNFKIVFKLISIGLCYKTKPNL
jgi:hypothetical protein